jgi:hypothetical protein
MVLSREINDKQISRPAIAGLDICTYHHALLSILFYFTMIGTKPLTAISQ